MKVVYIAGPFRAKSYWEQEQNIRRAEELAWKVWALGNVAVICPHANTRFYQGSLPDQVWLEGDLELVRRSDALLMVPGWQYSTGAKSELAFAHANAIPTFYNIDELGEWLNG